MRHVMCHVMRHVMCHVMRSHDEMRVADRHTAQVEQHTAALEPHVRFSRHDQR
jgi:hypothetical protein